MLARYNDRCRIDIDLMQFYFLSDGIPLQKIMPFFMVVVCWNDFPWMKFNTKINKNMKEVYFRVSQLYMVRRFGANKATDQ